MGVVVVAFVSLLIGEGGDSLFGALAIAAVWAVLAAAALSQTWARTALDRGAVLVVPGCLLALTALVALWSLSPFIPGGPHPAWTYVRGATAAATLNKSLTLVRVVALGGLSCAGLVGFVLGRRDSRARVTLQAILALGAAWAVISLGLYGGNLLDHPRLTGGLSSANVAATILAALATVAVSGALSEHRRDSRRSLALVYWAAAGLFGLCLLLSASRGGAIAAVCGMITLFALEALAGRVNRRAMLIAAAGGLCLGLADGAALYLRATDASVATGDRIELFGEYWRAFLASPLFGYGLGAFEEVNRLLLTPQSYPVFWDVRAAHNVYLQWLLEAGMIGALPMFLAIALLIGSTWRGLQRRTRSRTLIHGLLAADVVFLVHGWSDFSLQVPAVATLWAIMLGLQLGLAHGASEQR